MADKTRLDMFLSVFRGVILLCHSREASLIPNFIRIDLRRNVNSSNLKPEKEGTIAGCTPFRESLIVVLGESGSAYFVGDTKALQKRDIQ